MTKKEIQQIKAKIINILKEGEWKSEWNTYHEVSDYIINALKLE